MASDGKVTPFVAPNGVKCSLRTQCFINNEWVDAGLCGKNSDEKEVFDSKCFFLQRVEKLLRL